MADEVIDADGDLTVVCGGVSFQVFTQPIACASPVFRAMLLSDFAEGVAVRKSEPSKPAVVELPEDDPEAFHIFCDLAHHKLDHLPRDLEVDSMDKLAIFADKYQCALLMKTKGRSWIVRTLHYYDYEPEELWLLLHFAYVLDSQDCFSRIARMLVEDSKKSFVRWRYARDNMRTFPDELLAQLDLFYYKVKEQMQMALMDPVLELSKHLAYVLGLTQRLLFVRASKFRDWVFAMENLGPIPEALIALFMADILDTNLDELAHDIAGAITQLFRLMILPNGEYPCGELQKFIASYTSRPVVTGMMPGTTEFTKKSFAEIRTIADKFPAGAYLDGSKSRYAHCECHALTGLDPSQNLKNELAKCIKKHLRGSFIPRPLKILGTVSPVFKTMFQPQFKEGPAIREHGNTKLSLPEDDPEVFKVFCDIAYHKLDSAPKDPDPEFLRRMPIFIDKYMCPEAFTHYGTL
ncbi:hypothetical protein BDW74DRAFT_175306 [Aspergillus multicolor]|uniref:BTB/POZ domain-containing protein n=1 Tax=Aspergillus multicolor TaxID=41759 RepID=UPI003CCDDF57